jgi:hypothetical protein
MRLSWTTAAAMLLLASVARADQPMNERPNGMGDHQVTIGVGLICNTAEQVDRYIKLRAGGDETSVALIAVNEEAKDPRACGLAAVAFMQDKTVETHDLEGKLVSIVRISIIAAFDGRRWAVVPAMTQYALMQPEGYAI